MAAPNDRGHADQHRRGRGQELPGVGAGGQQVDGDEGEQHVAEHVDAPPDACATGAGGRATWPRPRSAGTWRRCPTRPRPGATTTPCGTSTSATPNSTKSSARIATTCTATKTSASALRYRWVESIHAGVGRRPNVRSAWSRPQVHDATTRPHATSPPARAVYHQRCDATQLPPVRVCGWGWNWPVVSPDPRSSSGNCVGVAARRCTGGADAVGRHRATRTTRLAGVGGVVARGHEPAERRRPPRRSRPPRARDPCTLSFFLAMTRNLSHREVRVG